jgi:DNA-binding transcriptional regulator YhcF (GntR family)
MSLDPDDPRPPYVQVANALRAAILTRKFVPGDRLPSGKDLSTTYGVARMTIQQALRVLREEGLIVSRQGSGVFVRDRTERPIGLRPHLERAFEQPHVTIDFFGFSGETLHGALQEPLDKVRSGRVRPESIAVRMLLPNTSAPMVLPCRADDLSDDPDFRERAAGIRLRHTAAVTDSIQELADMGLVQEATIQVRLHNSSPLFKLYVLNGTEAFLGFYEVKQHTVVLRGEERSIYDLMGKDVTLFHHAVTDDPDSIGSAFVSQARAWFESMWNTVSQEVPG